jgi:hypothetical protein
MLVPESNLEESAVRNIRVLVAVAAVILLAASPCQAGRRGWLRNPTDPTPLHGDGTDGHHAPPGYPRYQYSKQVYPKYYYGFHARYMQNIGVPTGDVGLRGNGIMYNPW